MNSCGRTFCLFVILHICCIESRTTQKEILEKVLSLGYDVNDSPRAAVNQKTDVHVQLYVNWFGSLNAADMDYTLDVFLRQKWRDTRLSYSEDRKNIVIQDPEVRKELWTPDTYFENVKEAKMHMVTIPNILFRFDKNGDVLYSMRINLKLACHMDLSRYPFDNQKCETVVSSYSNTADVIKYHWDDDVPIMLPDDLEISQFDLLDYKARAVTYAYLTGNFSGLIAHFSLRRQNGYHILQSYIPTILIVSVSWVSFWIDPMAVPGRVTLGVTTLLTLTTIATAIRQQLPPVSYVKAIDLWIGVCMVMVFGALLEFTLANWLANKRIPSVKVARRIAKFELSQGRMTRPPTTYISYALTVDRISRMLFPGTFLIFNFFYWPYYLLHQYTALFEKLF